MSPVTFANVALTTTAPGQVGCSVYGCMRQAIKEWLEDPHLNLGVLTPGQRYTVALVVLVAVLMMTIGVPR
jgi:hypothetical protein